MDLFSASLRYAAPFRFGLSETDPDPVLPIAARGMIGDGHTAALVRPDGVIDWLCFPNFESPAVFAGILDPERGGMTCVRPVRRRFDSLQAYDPDTNVLETLFTVPDEGIVRLTDFMPWTDDPRASIHEVHRRIQCRSGEVELELVFDPRFGFGERLPKFARNEHGVRATDGRNALVCVVGRDCTWQERPEGGLSTTVRLRKGEHCWMVLSWDAPDAEPLKAYRPFEQLRATRHQWREWSRHLRYDGPHRHHVMRSALALKLMIYSPTGAMVAAPTTSLPEWIGGGRNWDYRFTWTRDTAMAIRAANRIGYDREAREFFHFMRTALENEPELAVMYTVHGGPVPEERVLSHLRGYRGSLPVRIGNGARDQLQLDTAGALIDAAFLHEQNGGAIGLRTWRVLRNVLTTMARTWHQPDHGIWEPRHGVQQNVHSKLMCWLALSRGAKLADRFGDQAALDFHRSSDLVRKDVLAEAMDPSNKHFVSRYGGTDVDAALLLLPSGGFIEPDDPRMVATIDAIWERLGDGAFLHRYRVEDGVGGDEGAFVLCGFWLAEALARSGRLDEAQEVFAAHAEASNHLGLLGEEIAPTTLEQLGNFPQAFSHLGLVNSAIAIDRVLRRRDETALLSDAET